jgi:hypothetical protein
MRATRLNSGNISLIVEPGDSLFDRIDRCITPPANCTCFRTSLIHAVDCPLHAESVQFAEAPEKSQVALGGHDGNRAEALLQSSKRQGVNVLAAICRKALQRLLDGGNDQLLRATHLFSADELMSLGTQLTNTMATADLLGRSRIRLRQQKVTEHDRPTDFRVFAEGDTLKPLAPQNAIRYFRSLIPGLSESGDWYYGPTLERASFTLAQTADAEILKRIHSLILKVLETGEEVKKTPEYIDAILEDVGVASSNPNYSEALVRTSMMESFRKGSWREFSDPDVQDSMACWRWVGIHDGRERHGPSPKPDHLQHFGKYYSPNVSFFDVRGNDAANVINCVLPGNIVQGRAAGALKAWYSGEAVEIRYAAPERCVVSLTVNHPVFSLDGIVRAGQLNEGQYLWNYLAPFGRTTDQKEQQGPSRIEDVFESFSVSGSSKTSSPLDLYGDGAFIDGDIDVVRPKCSLPDNADFSKTKKILDFIFKHSFNSGVGSRCLSDSLFSRHFGPLESLSFTLSARLDSSQQESFSDGSPVSTKMLRKHVFGNAFNEIKFPQFIDGNLNAASVLRFGFGSELDIDFREPTANGFPFYTQFLSQLCERFAGKITSSKILKIRRFHYDGPVYDLETDVGYFLAGPAESASILIRNCRCDFYAVLKRQWSKLEAKGATITPWP